MSGTHLRNLSAKVHDAAWVRSPESLLRDRAPRGETGEEEKGFQGQGKRDKLNPITLEEIEDPKDEQQSYTCKPISTQARSKQPLEQKRSRLEEIICSARNRAKNTESMADPMPEATPKRLNKPPVDVGFPEKNF